MVSSKITLIYSILYIIDDVLMCKPSYVIFQFACSKNFILIQVKYLFFWLKCKYFFHHMHNP